MITEYFERMKRDGRYIGIYENGEQIGFVLVAICADYVPYENKPLWGFLTHNPRGHICYVEKMVSKKWNKEIRKSLEKAIVDRFPTVTIGIWYRPTKDNDRKVIRRVKYEASL